MSGLIAIAIAICLHRIYFANLDRIESALAVLPPAEANPPAAFVHAVLALEPEVPARWVARSFVVETFPERRPTIEWHLRNLVWWTLLPQTLTRDEIISLYAGFLQFLGGRGLTYGAAHHFSVSPEELTQRQVIELLVISRAPGAYSRVESRSRLDREIERRMALLAGLPEVEVEPDRGSR